MNLKFTLIFRYQIDLKNILGARGSGGHSSFEYLDFLFFQNPNFALNFRVEGV